MLQGASGRFDLWSCGGGGQGKPVAEQGVEHEVEEEDGQHDMGVEGQQGGAANGCQGLLRVLPRLQPLISSSVLGQGGAHILQPPPVGLSPGHCEFPPA